MGVVSLRRLGLITAVSLALAGYAAWLRSAGQADPARVRDAVPMVGGILLYRLGEVRALYREPSTRLLDVRPAAAYQAGHIPGVLSVPENDLDRDFPSLRAGLEKAKTIIIYCDSPRCARALRVAVRLRTEGLAQAQIYPGGWNEWVNRRMPVEHSAAN
jgi:rhodanese-related sulfurtransferase